MYIIACLCMLKIYETRHPDVQAKAYQSYFFMAVIIFVAVLGVVCILLPFRSKFKHYRYSQTYYQIWSGGCPCLLRGAFLKYIY
jgi:hypothetical protein